MKIIYKNVPLSQIQVDLQKYSERKKINQQANIYMKNQKIKIRINKINHKANINKINKIVLNNHLFVKTHIK